MNKSFEDKLDKFLAEAATTTKPYAVRDRCGLRISFAGMLPTTEGNDKEERTWGASIILNAADLEFNYVRFALRVQTKKTNARNSFSCNNSKGKIKPKDVLVVAYQLKESAIDTTQLTLIIDGSPYGVPLFKIQKSDYYWLGKDTKVPTAADLYQKRKGVKLEDMYKDEESMDKTPKHTSPGRIDNISEGLQNFLLNNNGFSSFCKLLQPHANQLFKELSEQKTDTFPLSNVDTDKNMTDYISEEIVRRFHEMNRQKYVTTPALIQKTD